MNIVTQKWSEPENAVSCGVCGNSFHLSCVGFEKRPARGTLFSCTDCSASTRVKTLEETLEQLTPPANPIWPFRYFGEYSRVQDLLYSTNEQGNPKASSRIGKAYQAFVPEFNAEEPSGSKKKSKFNVYADRE